MLPTNYHILKIYAYPQLVRLIERKIDREQFGKPGKSLRTINEEHYIMGFERDLTKRLCSHYDSVDLMFHTYEIIQVSSLPYCLTA